MQRYGVRWFSASHYCRYSSEWINNSLVSQPGCWAKTIDDFAQWAALWAEQGGGNIPVPLKRTAATGSTLCWPPGSASEPGRQVDHNSYQTQGRVWSPHWRQTRLLLLQDRDHLHATEEVVKGWEREWKKEKGGGRREEHHYRERDGGVRAKGAVSPGSGPLPVREPADIRRRVRRVRGRQQRQSLLQHLRRLRLW